MRSNFTSFLLLFALLFTFFTSQAQVTNYASLPYSTGFESGVLDPNWYTTSSGPGGRIQIWNSSTLTWSSITAMAHTDSLWLGMDNSPGGTYVTNESWMGLNLLGYTNVRLTFWWAEWNDESEPEDGVYMSDNGGTTFTKVLNLPGANYTDLQWYYFNLNIDSLAAIYNFNLTANFVVKFQQRDNYYFAGGNDGHLYDDILVTGTAGCDSPPLIVNCPADTTYMAGPSCSAVASFPQAEAVNFGCNSTLKITEINTNSPDFLEIQNQLNTTKDYTGWFVAISDDYSNINIVNSLFWQLGTMTSGQIMFREDVTGANYWGNNIFYSSGNNSWAMIIDNYGNVHDAVFWGWDSTSIANFSATINGFNVTIPPSVWSGPGVGASCGTSLARQDDLDHDDASDWACVAATKGTANANYSPTLKPEPTVTQVAGIASGGTYPGGVTQNILVATDVMGLKDSCIFNITVQDLTAPVASCQSSLSLQLPSDGDTTLMGGTVDNGSSDNCGITSWSLSKDYFTCADIGSTFTVQLTIADNSGNTDSCTTSIMVNDNLNLTALAVNLGPDQTVCPGNSATLDAGNAGSTFLWSNGATTQTINAANSQDYSVIVTNGLGCEGMDTVNVSLAPSADLGPDQDICAGGSTTLDPGITGQTYSWSTGATSSTLTVNAAGSYSVTVTDANGCVSSDTVNVSILPAPTSAFTATQQAGNGLTWDFTDNSTGSPSSWAWDFGDGSGTSTQQNPTYTYSSEGTYTVTLVVTNACGSNTSTQTITLVGIEGELAGMVLQIYPNPNHGQFTLEASSNAERYELQIQNLQGQEVFRQTVQNGSGYVKTDLNLQGVSQGVYLLRISTEKATVTRKIIIE
ncbi:MAG: T9SS type A sorting domain-containing protein [Bacteroidia bacterium]|nr:T9SS type A sorting domain-containing protein [Bacteroidia bacterium]